MRRISIAFAALAALMVVGVASVINTGMNASDDQNLSAAYRDGTFLGTRAAAAGQQPHISAGRWMTSADRQSFTDGYLTAFTQESANRGTVSAHDDASVSGTNSAAFRDGVFSGKLHAEAGRPVHVTSGRWARPQDQALFAAGYQQAYEGVASERAALRRNNGNRLP